MTRQIRAALVMVSLSGALLSCNGGTTGTVLQHDDGTMEAKRSITGGGHAVLFETPDDGDWYLDKVEVYGSRYGTYKAPDASFHIYVTDAAISNYYQIEQPYGTFDRGREKWVRIKTPRVKLPREFYVCLVFDPGEKKGVYVGLDRNGTEKYSKNAIPGSHALDVLGGGNWMIRAHLSRDPKGESLRLQSSDVWRRREEEARAAQDARFLEGAKSVTLEHDGGTMDDHLSYGGRQAHAIQFEAPEGDWFVYRVAFYGSQFGGRHDSEAVNGDVYILDKDLRIISRTSFPYSHLSHKKEWVEIPTLATKVTGRFYVVIHTHSEKFKGIYAGYDARIKRSHSSAANVSRGSIELDRPDKKLEWMIRAKLADRPIHYE